MSAEASTFRVRFWGVRGSRPAPGPATARYGGNTSCVSVEGAYMDGTERVGVLDSGTGIHDLGAYLAEDRRDLILLLTHTHWDHIQGFPFFAPLYEPDRTIYLSSYERARGLYQLLMEQMDGVRFPLTQEQIQSHLDSYTPLEIHRQEREGYAVRRLRVNHPGETYGFRLELRGVTIVYIPDNEINPPYEPLATFEDLTAFCRGADVLIHDAQYGAADLPRKRGWGHSLASEARELGLAAGVRHLALFHHDPERTDDELDALQEESRAWFAARDPAITCTVAYEGLEIVLPL